MSIFWKLIGVVLGGSLYSDGISPRSHGGSEYPERISFAPRFRLLRPFATLPRFRNRFARLLLPAFIAVFATGCVSTEELYARYDQPACLALTKPEAAVTEPTPWHWAVLFPYNSNEITKDQSLLLQDNLTILKANPQYRVVLRGFTDSVASQRYNLKLSQQRVETVAQWLLSQGLASSQIESHWAGKSLPLVERRNGGDESVNRRVELLLLDASGQPVAFNTRNNTPRSPALKVSQKGLNTVLYHHRHSREGGNPSAAVDPRLRGDDGCWRDMTLCDSLALRGNADEGLTDSPERSGHSGMHSHGDRGNEAVTPAVEAG